MRNAVDANEQLWGGPAPVSGRFGYADIWKTNGPHDEPGPTPKATAGEIVRPEVLWDEEPEPDRPVALPDAEPSLTWSAPAAEEGADLPPPASRPRYVLPDTFVAISPKARSWRERLSAFGVNLALAILVSVLLQL